MKKVKKQQNKQNCHKITTPSDPLVEVEKVSKKEAVKLLKDFALKNSVFVGKKASEYEKEVFEVLKVNVQANEKWAVDLFYRYIIPERNRTLELVEINPERDFGNCKNIDEIIQSLVKKLISRPHLSESKTMQLIQVLNGLKIAEKYLTEDSFFANLTREQKETVARWRVDNLNNVLELSKDTQQQGF